MARCKSSPKWWPALLQRPSRSTHETHDQSPGVVGAAQQSNVRADSNTYFYVWPLQLQRIARPRSRLIVHNDSDLYSSTLFTLANLNMLLVPGVVVILDDFSHATHVFRAFADYRSAFWRSAHPVAMTSNYALTVAFVID